MRYRCELSLRTSGTIAVRLTEHWYEDEREQNLGFASVGVMAPLNGHMVVGLVNAWRDLGYMTKICQNSWVEAALAVEMLKNLKFGA